MHVRNYPPYSLRSQYYCVTLNGLADENKVDDRVVYNPEVGTGSQVTRLGPESNAIHRDEGQSKRRINQR